MTSRKRRRKRDETCVFSAETHTCGESFSTLLQNIKSSENIKSAARKLMQTSDRTEESPHISWSDSSESDSELKKRRPVTSEPARGSVRTHRHLCEDTDDDLDLDIDIDVSHSEDEKESCPNISDCDSVHDDPDVASYDPATTHDLDISPDQDDPDVSRPEVSRSVSDWVRSAQVLLQTPHKSGEPRSKTPEDSSGKRRKLKSGGLADRLNRLQRRLKSSVSFWRHQSGCGSTTKVDGPGLLVLELQACRQECSMQVLRCQSAGDLGSQDAVVVLLNPETSARLGAGPGDRLHVHPPWQKLSLQSLGCDVLLSTHFTHKVFCASKSGAAAETPPSSLSRTFGLQELGDDPPQVLAPEGPRSFQALGSWTRHSSSLLEVIERLGQAGSVGQQVEVTVQRVYAVPVQDGSSALKPGLPSAAGDRSRLCLLVQDYYGMFSVVQLQVLPSKDHLQSFCQVCQGKTVLLKGIKVVQRVTRDRSARLFTLIDSLWPPKTPPRCHGNTRGTWSSQPAPSFCYLLSGQESSLEPTGRPSDLFVPASEQTLQQLLQIRGRTVRCSFTALVVHRRLQEEGRAEVWLVLTDDSLQDASEEPPRRTVAMCVKTSCVITSCVLEALKSTSTCRLRFRDAVKVHDVFLCDEHSVLESLEGSELSPWSLRTEPPTRPVRLDPPGLQISVNSLCSLSGVVVGVEPSSCCARLDSTCSTCRWSLEVHLSCAELPECSVKVKLQQQTITSVLKAAALPAHELRGHGVQSILGREVGPLAALVRVVTRRPSMWIGLEEINLQAPEVWTP